MSLAQEGRSRLPTELWRYISVFVRDEDHRSLRAVNRTFQAICRPVQNACVRVRLWKIHRGKNGKTVLFKGTSAMIPLPNYAGVRAVRSLAQRIWPLLDLSRHHILPVTKGGKTLRELRWDAADDTCNPPVFSLTEQDLEEICLVPAACRADTCGPDCGLRTKVLRMPNGDYDLYVCHVCSTVEDFLTKAGVKAVSDSPEGSPLGVSGATLPRQLLLYTLK